MHSTAIPSGPPQFELRRTRQPMLWAAATYSLGIVAGTYFWRPLLWWSAASILFLAFAAYFIRHRPWLAKALVLSGLFLAGAMHIQLRSQSDRVNTEINPLADGRELQIAAHVIRDGRVQPGSFGEMRQTLDVETEEVKTGADAGMPLHSGIRMSIYVPRGRSSGDFNLTANNSEEAGDIAVQNQSSDSMRVFHYGERLLFTAKLKLPRNFRNPGAFDYQGYLAD